MVGWGVTNSFHQLNGSWSHTMFPVDRFNSLLPNAKTLHEDLKKTAEAIDFIPNTSKELGSKLVLHQFVPAWDVQAYLRFAKLDLHVENSQYPCHEATGELPQLSDGNFLLPKEHIIPHLQTFHRDIDDTLSDDQKADVCAFRGLITHQLQLVVEFCRWVDAITYKEVTRPLLKKVIPFPISQWVPSQMHNRMKIKLHQNGIHSREQAYVLARDCYASLEAKLVASKGKFFFGDSPTSLDALVFGHVTEALRMKQLGEVLHKHGSSLISLSERIRDSFFNLKQEDHLAYLSQDAHYSMNHENFFSTQTDDFMYNVPTSSHVPFLQPYRSLNWHRREILGKVANQKRTEGGSGHDAARGGSSTDASPEVDRTFDKSSRNLVIGGLITLVLYGLSTIPVNLAVDALGGLDDEQDDEYYDDDDY